MTTKQRYFFTAEMCLGMGSIMSLIGNLFAQGITKNAFTSFLVWWMPTIILAFVYNLGVASQITNRIIRWATRAFTDEDHILQRAATIRGWSQIIIMCFSMATYGIIIGGGLSHLTIISLLITWARSFVLAYIIRGVLVKPLARKGLAMANIR